MSAIDPVILFPAAPASRGSEIGRAFAAAPTLGSGPFCTDPGLVPAVDGPGLAAFPTAASEACAGTTAATMPTPGIHRAYRAGVAALASNPAVTRQAQGQPGTAYGGQPALFATTAQAFLQDHRLAEEAFGAASLVVRCGDAGEIRAVLDRLEGPPTAALHVDADEHAAGRALMPLLEREVGRILVDGFGTGAEVGHAMVHGGPVPATSDGRSASVGSLRSS